jgi:hypothetical protein
MILYSSQSWAIGAHTAQTLLPRQRFFGVPYEADSLNIGKKVTECSRTIAGTFHQ